MTDPLHPDPEIQHLVGLWIASLDPCAVAVDPDHDSPSWAQRRLHRHRWPYWITLYAASLIAYGSDKPGRRFRACCAHPIVQRNEDDGCYRVVSSACNHRLCPHCADRLALDIADRTRLWMLQQPCRHWRFMTLTLKSSREPLKMQLARLRASFRKLRQQSIWRKTQRRGRAHIEVTWSVATRMWHPHLHVIADGRYLPQRSLSRAWLKATGDSRVVDIRAIKSVAQAAKYVAKYASKPVHGATAADHLPIDAAVDLLRCARKGRWVIPYGDFAALPPPTSTPATGHWVHVAFLEDVWQAAQISYDAYSLSLLSRLDIVPPTRAGPDLQPDDGLMQLQWI